MSICLDTYTFVYIYREREIEREREREKERVFFICLFYTHYLGLLTCPRSGKGEFEPRASLPRSRMRQRQVRV